MKTPLMKLTADERAILAHFNGSETHRVLVKLLEIERLELAKDHVGVGDIGQIRYLSGKAEGLRALILTLKQAKQYAKEEDAEG